MPMITISVCLLCLCYAALHTRKHAQTLRRPMALVLAQHCCKRRAHSIATATATATLLLLAPHCTHKQRRRRRARRANNSHRSNHAEQASERAARFSLACSAKRAQSRASLAACFGGALACAPSAPHSTRILYSWRTKCANFTRNALSFVRMRAR